MGEGIAAAGEGGTGGEDIVDEEDMVPFELFGMADGEGIFDVEKLFKFDSKKCLRDTIQC